MKTDRLTFFKIPPSIVMLEEGFFSATSEYFSLLSDPCRLRILLVLGDERKEFSISQIMDYSGFPRSVVYRHLKRLLLARVVERHCRMGGVFFCLNDPTLFDLCRVAMAKIHENNPNSQSSQKI